MTATAYTHLAAKGRDFGAPDTIRACDLCLRRAALILRPQYRPKLSPARGSDNASAQQRTAARKFSCSINAKTTTALGSCLGGARAARYFAAELNGLVRRSEPRSGTARAHLVLRCCTERMCHVLRGPKSSDEALEMKGKCLNCQPENFSRPRYQLDQTKQ